jgi:hypothetical protein
MLEVFGGQFHNKVALPNVWKVRATRISFEQEEAGQPSLWQLNNNKNKLTNKQIKNSDCYLQPVLGTYCIYLLFKTVLYVESLGMSQNWFRFLEFK